MGRINLRRSLKMAALLFLIGIFFIFGSKCNYAKQVDALFKTLSSKGSALSSAKNYLEFMSFSYTGLIKQLEFEDYSHEDAVYAADNCGANWNEQAVKSAKNYLRYTSFSYDGLVKQLEFEGFTNLQAKYGANEAMGLGGSKINDNGISVSKENALKSAKNYLDFSAFSYKGLVKQLEFEDYSHEDAVYAADNCGANWNEQAVKSAKSYLDFMSFSKNELINQLKFEGFTSEQAKYAVKEIGY